MIEVGVKIKGEPVSFGAAAQFGTKDGDRYFFLDVMANLGPAKIPVFTGIYLKAIGGGYYQNMVRDERRVGFEGAGPGGLDSLLQTYPPPTTDAPPDFVGRTISGRQLTVSDAKSYGAFLQLVLVTEGQDAVSVMGGLGFETSTAACIGRKSRMTGMTPACKTASAGSKAKLVHPLVTMECHDHGRDRRPEDL